MFRSGHPIELNGGQLNQDILGNVSQSTREFVVKELWRLFGGLSIQVLGLEALYFQLVPSLSNNLHGVSFNNEAELIE